MSRDRAIKTIRLEPADRVATHENLDHPGLMEELLDYDPWESPQQAFVDTFRAVDLDWRDPEQMRAYDSEASIVYYDYPPEGTNAIARSLDLPGSSPYDILRVTKGRFRLFSFEANIRARPAKPDPVDDVE